MTKHYLVTGGTGFLGRSLVERLLIQGNYVSILDNDSRGSVKKLHFSSDKLTIISGDIRNKHIVTKACNGIDTIVHLAFVNGTNNFYQNPDLVLDVAVKGMINLLDCAIAQHVKEFFLASSSEVYNDAPIIPTPETVPVIIPDIFNPRFSYAGGKIISELLAIHNSKHFKKTVIFRPHNVFGPAMGNDHVIPQCIVRMKELVKKKNKKFAIQGDGSQSRSFIYIDDFTSALMLLLKKGKNLQVYHIGTEDEITIRDLVRTLGNLFEINISIIPGMLTQGSPKRRCPDTTKIKKLGFSPKLSLEQGLKKTIDWYLHE